MLINLRNALMSGRRTPTAKDYVQDGLIVMYDSVENAGWGVHDSNAAVWTELVGLPFVSCNLPMRDHTILDNGVLCESRLPMVKRPADPYAFMAAISEGYTIQLAITLSDDEMSGGLAGLSGAGLYMTSNADSYGQQFVFSVYNPKKTFAFRLSPQMTTFTIEGDASENITKYLYGDEVMHALPSFSIFSADSTFYPAIGINSPGRVSDTYGAGAGNGVIYHNFRIYSRALTASEIARNYAIDKARFLLP